MLRTSECYSSFHVKHRTLGPQRTICGHWLVLSVLSLQKLHRLGPVIMRQQQPSELHSDCSEGIGLGEAAGRDAPLEAETTVHRC